jgi:hypothetical protein
LAELVRLSSKFYQDYRPHREKAIC